MYYGKLEKINYSKLKPNLLQFIEIVCYAENDGWFKNSYDSGPFWARIILPEKMTYNIKWGKIRKVMEVMKRKMLEK